MKQCIYFLGFISLSIVLLSSCNGNVLKGEGKNISSTLTVPPFTAIDISVMSKAIITIKPGAQPVVVISGFENHVKHIKSRTQNSKLSIYSDLDESWSFGSNHHNLLKITVPSLESLNLNGITDADIYGNLSGKDFKLDISGAGKVLIENINVTDFSTVVSGTATIDVKGGTVHSANYQVNGAVKINAFPLQTSELITSISGTANAELTALQKLSVDINGNGKIKYKGHPALTQQISGAGTITDAN